MPAKPITKEQHNYIWEQMNKPEKERPSNKDVSAALGVSPSVVTKYKEIPPDGDPLRLPSQPAPKPDSPPENALEADLRRLLKNRTLTLYQIADAVDVSPARALGAINAFKAKGGMIVGDEDGYSLQPHELADPGKAEAIGMPTGEWTHTFGVTSDNHLCNKHSRLDVLKEAYDTFDELGITKVFNAGNWIDGEHKFNRNELITAPGLDRQIDYLIDQWPIKNGIETHFIAGDDHEGWYQQREGIEIGRYLQTRAEDQGRSDLKYLGYAEADVALRKGSGSAVMRVVHPGGGSSYAISYTDQKRIESYQGGEKPQVELAGHYHKFNYGTPREVHAIQVGCTCDQTLFMRKKKLQAMVGFLVVRIAQDDSGIITRVQLEWSPRFNRGYYEKRFR